MELITWITSYVIIILCELGDKTQLATLLLASNHPRRKWLIFLASALALSLCVVLEVTVGRMLAEHIGIEQINRAAGFVFVAIGLIILVKR